MIRKFFKWICTRGKPIEITLIKKEFSWPDAGQDPCLVCNVRREYHAHQDHLFQTKGDTQ